MTKIAGTKESGFKTKRNVFFINNNIYFVIDILSFYKNKNIGNGGNALQRYAFPNRGRKR